MCADCSGVFKEGRKRDILWAAFELWFVGDSWERSVGAPPTASAHSTTYLADSLKCPHIVVTA